MRILVSAIVVSVVFASVGGAQEITLPEGPLTLDECIDIALENHSRIAIAQEGVLSAGYDVRRARSSYYPEVALEWQYTTSESRGGGRYTELGGVPVEVGAVTTEQHQTTAVARYNFWNSGYREAELRRAKNSLTGERAYLEGERQRLAFQVTQDYYGLLEARKNLEIATEAVDLAERNLEAVKARIESEVAAEADRFLFQAELSNARFNEVAARNAVSVAATGLRNSLGLGLGPPLAVVEPGPPRFDEPDFETLLEAARGNRPELIESATALANAKEQVRLVRITRNPYLSIDGRYSYKPEPAPWGTDWTISASVSLPVFDAGDRAAQQRTAEASLRQAELRYEQLEKDVAAEVESAYFDLVSSKPSYEAATAGVEEAKTNLEATNEKNRLGLAIPLEVVDAQVSYSNAQLRAVRALYDYHVAIGRLALAIGGPPPSSGE